jgi:type II secretory pathway pseudopilin PulG
MRLYRQKQTFILLEILVAIAIVSLLAGFLIYRPFRELKKN